ncbi:MAG: hypothetical protein E7300_04175 [Lachnospiraceae bacterium]|nr:hypothetical protein [Lachnospiraceae bacterium]
MKKVNQGLSLLMSLLLCVTSFNFSLIAKAEEANAAKIIGFNQLDESIAVQSLPVGASLDDVVFPDSIKATVETVEQVEVKKPVEKQTEASDEEQVTPVEETVEENISEIEAEPVEQTEATEEVESEVPEQTEGTEEKVEAAPVEESTPVEETAPENNETESVNISLVDILFPAMVAKAAELEEGAEIPLAGATAKAAQSIPKTEYETVMETKTVQSEITIENVNWEEVTGAQFDSSAEATYTFEPVFTTDYVVATALPIITVNIVNADSTIAFDKSVVIDGIRISVKADAGVFPEGATLSATKVYGSDLQAVEAAVDEERGDDKNKVESYTFDIKVLDAAGNEIEPDNSKGQVKVSFTLEEVADANLETDVYHVKGEVGNLSVDKLAATETAATTVEAVTDGFSFYTVEFTYNNLQYVMNGDTTVALSDILDYVGLQGTVTNAVSDAPELFSVTNTENGWMVTANKAFNTEQKLTVTIDEREYEVVVTDSTLEPVKYLEATWDENNNKCTYTEKTTNNYIEVDANSTTWSDGSYVVNSNITISNRITATGSVKLILCDGATLTAPKGITVGSNATLNIYAQSEGSGTLDISAPEYEYAAIGGYSDYVGEGETVIAAGTINIHGGNLTVTGGYGAAAIGGGRDSTFNSISIYGGTINATSGGSAGAAIGTGDNGSSSGKTITIYGGTIKATGVDCAAGIGGGGDNGAGTVIINGGEVTAIAGFSDNDCVATGIGAAAYRGYSESVIINGGTVIAKGGSENTAGIGKRYFYGQGVQVGSITLGENVKLSYSTDGTNYTTYETADYSVRAQYMKAETQHVHDFKYSANGDTITAVCQNAYCDIKGDLTLKISAPADLKYNGEVKTATLNTYNATAFPDTYEIKYYQGENEIASSAVKEPGAYTAKVSVGNVTASVDFTITKTVEPEEPETGGTATATFNGSEDVITTPSGLEKQANELAKDGDKVELKLGIDRTSQGKATQVLSNDEKMHSEVKNLFKNEETVEVDVLEIDITKYVNNSDEGNISNTDEVLEIGIPYDFTGKYDPTIVRKHGTEQHTFRALSSRPSSYEDKTFYADVDGGKLYIYSNKFSEYVIAYSTEPGNAQNRTASTGGSSSSSGTYPTTVPVYRLFNTVTGQHFYTANKEERDLILEKNGADGWTDEGIAFETAQKTSIPVYRVFDLVNGNHIFTTDAAARDMYIANGCRDEGIAWYAPVIVGRKVYKLTDAKSNKVTYTTSKAEADSLVDLGFTCEDAEFVVY